MNECAAITLIVTFAMNCIILGGIIGAFIGYKLGKPDAAKGEEKT